MLDHYLEILARRPGALPAATALVTARAAGLFTGEHEAFWTAARRAHGDSAGTRALIGVLLLHLRLPTHAVLAGIAAALALGRLDPELVAVEARRHLEAARPETASVVAATGGSSEQLPRPAPTLRGYDSLLTPTLPVSA